MYDSGAVIPVEDKFESTGYDKSSVMDVISSYYTVEGKQYAMPFNVSTPMLYYNKDVFEAAGLDPETPPTTYDEVLEDAKKILAKSRKEKLPIVDDDFNLKGLITNKLHKTKKFQHFKEDDVWVKTNQYVNIDGEKYEPGTYHLKCLHKKIQLVY